MELLGLFLWVIIGILFGLMGAGGSILTLPILVYLFRIDVSTATTYSLFIVGSTSLLGALSYIKQGFFDKKAAIDFGIPSLISVVITKIFIAPLIPDILFHMGNMLFTKDTFLLCLLAIIMLTSSYRIITHHTKRGQETKNVNAPNQNLLLTINGIIVGFLSAMIGVGGGFLIIPALIVLSKLDIKQAVGTSLAIIAIQSIVGFMSDYFSYHVDWSLIIPITAVASIGVLLGSLLSKKVNAEKLKVALGWFIGLTAFCIIAEETILKIM